MYQISELLKVPKLIHGISTVDEGNMSFKFSSKRRVIRNREKFLEKLGISVDDCVCMYAVHGDEIVEVDQSFKRRGMDRMESAIKVDGLVTDEKGVYLFLLIGDCLPIILHDPVKGVVGLVHAGWTGADINVVSKAIEKMNKRYKVLATDIIAGLGPAALKDSFIKENPSQIGKAEWKSFIEQVSDKEWKIDFVGYCRQQLLDLGVREENVFESGIDTVKDKRFFSHHRDSGKDVKKQGRFECVVGLK